MNITKLRVVVSNSVAPGERPPRDQVAVYFPDGTLWEGPLVSPSALDTFSACERKWAFNALDKVPRTQTPAQLLGGKGHEQLEGWLRAGQPPTLPLLKDSGALVHFPPPYSPGLQIEEVFAFLVDLESERVVFWGFKDAALPGLVLDLKTTSDFRWAKTPADLLRDTQAIIYAVDGMLSAQATSVRLRWVYTVTRGRPASQPVEAVIDWDTACSVLRSKLYAARKLSAFRQTFGLTAAQLEPNPTACGDFGGCEYRALCDPHAPVQPLKGHQMTMSLIERVRASARVSQATLNQPAPVVAVTMSSAPPAPAAPAAVQPQAPAAVQPEAPAVNPLASLASKLVAARPQPPSAVAASAPAVVTSGVGRIVTELRAPPVAVNAPDAAPPDADDAPLAGGKRKKASKKDEARPVVSPDDDEEFVLYVDVLAWKGPHVPHNADQLVSAARDLVEAEAGKSYRLLDYNDGPKLLAAQVSANCLAAKPRGHWYVSSRLVDKEVLEALVRAADRAFKGVV